MKMYLNSYVPVYPVPTSFTTSLTLKRNIHLHETISVIEEQSKKKMEKRKNTYIHERTKFDFTEISVERNTKMYRRNLKQNSTRTSV